MKHLSVFDGNTLNGTQGRPTSSVRVVAAKRAKKAADDGAAARIPETTTSTRSLDVFLHATR
jgi:hypothetical protein